MKKRALSTLVGLCLALSLLPAEALGAEPAETETAAETAETTTAEPEADRETPETTEAETKAETEATDEEAADEEIDTPAPETTEPEAETPLTLPDPNGKRTAERASGEARYQTEEGGEWVYGSLHAAIAQVYIGGTVEVLNDIVLENGVDIRRSVTITSANPSAPCKISYVGKAYADYAMSIHADTVLKDIILDGRHEEGFTSLAELIYVDSSRTLTMESGTILQNNSNAHSSESAGGLWVNGGTAIMQKGSVIRNCRGSYGGGAGATTGKGMLVLNGGIVEDCEAFIGGGVYLKGGATLRLYDDSAIRRNAARKELDGMSYGGLSPKNPGKGGGVFVYSGQVYSLGATTGATIANNSADDTGGGIYVSNGLVQLANGSITENHAGWYGGGIISSPYTDLKIGNSPKVFDNSSAENASDNIFLDGIENSSGDITRPMTIGAALADNSLIGASRWVEPDEAHPYRIVANPGSGYTITESDLSKFFSDNPAYAPLLHEGKIVLTTADVIFDTQGHGGASFGRMMNSDRKVTEPDAPSEEGYAFEGWYREPECVNRWDFENDTIAENADTPLTLYAKWEPIVYRIDYVLDGGKNASGNPSDYTIESADIALKAPTKTGYAFTGWTWDGQSEPQKSASIPTGSTGDKAFTAHWKKGDPDPSGGGDSGDPGDGSGDDDPSVEPTPNADSAPTSEASASAQKLASTSASTETSTPLSKTGDSAQAVLLALCALAILAEIISIRRNQHPKPQH